MSITVGIKEVGPTCGHHNGRWYCPDHEIGDEKRLR